MPLALFDAVTLSGSNTVTVSAAEAHSPTHSAMLSFDGITQNAYLTKRINAQSEIFVEMWLWVDSSLSAATVNRRFSVLEIWSKTKAKRLASVCLMSLSGGEWKFQTFVNDGSSDQTLYDASTVTTNSWLQLELHWKAGSGSNGGAEFRLNGATLGSNLALSLSQYTADTLYFGSKVNQSPIPQNGHLYLDDITIATDTWVGGRTLTDSALLYINIQDSPANHMIEAAQRTFAVDARSTSFSLTGIRLECSNQYVLGNNGGKIQLSGCTYSPGALLQASVPFTGLFQDSMGRLYSLLPGNPTPFGRSTDGGQSWITLKLFEGECIGRDAYVSTAGIIFVSTYHASVTSDHGIWRSQDDGLSWSKVYDLETIAPSATVWKWCEDLSGNIYAGMYSEGTDADCCRVLKSSDGGQTFTQCYFNPSARHIHDVECDHSTGAVYITQGDYIAPWYAVPAIFKSMDQGATWVQILTQLHQLTGVCITPTSRILLIDAQQVGVYRTTDDINAPQTLNLSANSGYGFWIERDPISGRVFVSFVSTETESNSSMIYFSDDDGETWGRLTTFPVSVQYDGSQLATHIVSGKLYMDLTTAGDVRQGLMLQTE